MLKVTWITRRRRVWLLKLEGEIRGPWVEVVRETLAQRDSPSRRVRLDISGVTYVDAAGAQVLRNFLSDGTEIAACSSFVAELLHLEDLDDPPSNLARHPSPLRPPAGDRTKPTRRGGP